MPEELITIPRPELGRPTDPRLTADYIAAHPELEKAGYPAFDPEQDVDWHGEVENAIQRVQAQVSYADPALYENLVGLQADNQKALADIAQSAALAVSAAGITPVANVAAVGETPGLYRAMDTGRVYERPEGGGDPVPRADLEAAPVQQVEALDNQLQPSALDAVPDGAARAWLGDLEHRPYNGPDAADGTIIKQDGKGRKFKVNFTGIAQVDWWKTVKTDGSADVAPGLSEAAAWARKKGKALFIPGGTDKKYLLSSRAVIPAGVTISGEGFANDNPGKSDNSVPFSGSVFLVRGNGQLQMATGSMVERAAFVYDEQRYLLDADSAQADGIQAFKPYPALILSQDNYGAPTVRELGFFGGSGLFSSTSADGNPEKLIIQDVRGFFTGECVRIPIASDVPRVTGLFMNGNSVYSLLSNQMRAAGIDPGAGFDPSKPVSSSNPSNWSVYSARMHTKTAKNSTLFALGRVDDIMIDHCFVYAAREFLRFDIFDSRDNGNGGGASVTNSAGDVVNSAFRIGRSDMVFGLRVSNFWFATNVWKIVYDNAVQGDDPTLLRLSGTSQNCSFQFSNGRVFGGPVPQVADSASMYQYLAGNGGSSRVKLSNVDLEHGSILTGGPFSNTGSNNTHMLTLNGVSFRGRQLRGETLIQGGYVAAVSSDTVVGTFSVDELLKLREGCARGTAQVGPTAAGTVVFTSSGGSVLGTLSFPAGANTATFTPGPGSVDTGDRIVATAKGMAGASGVSWSLRAQAGY